MTVPPLNTTSASSFYSNSGEQYAEAVAFDLVYLGSFSSPPTLNNQGEALAVGQLYWNTTEEALNVYTGTGWVSYLPSNEVVTSFNGETGVVVPEDGDYSFSQLSGNISVGQMDGGTAANTSTYWRGDGTWAGVAGASGGTVTSVAMTVPSGLAISGSPITGAGTFALSWSGTIPASSLPSAAISAIGGVQAIAGVSHQWIASINTSGVPQLSQPAFSDISGSIALTQLPTMSSDTFLANSSGSSATPTAITGAQAEQLLDFTQVGTGATQRLLDAKLKDSVVVSVTDFGADPTGNTDSTTAFQTAATYLGTTGGPFGVANGKVLFIPKGIYNLSGEIDFDTAGVSVIGEGTETTKLYVASNLGSAKGLFKFHQSDTTYSNVGTNVENLFIDMQGFTGHGIWMMKPYDGSGLRKVYITQVADAYNGVRIEPDPNNTGDSISQSLVLEAVWCDHLNTTATAPLFYGVHLQECTFIQCKGISETGASQSASPGFYFQDCRGIQLYGCSTANATVPGVSIAAVSEDVVSILIDQMTFESISGCVSTSVSGGFHIYNLVVRAPRYEGSVSNASGDYQLNSCIDADLEIGSGTVVADSNSSLLRIVGNASSTITNSGTYSGTVTADALSAAPGTSGTLTLGSGSAGNVSLSGSSGTGNLTINAANTVGGSILLQSRGSTVCTVSPGAFTVGTPFSTGTLQTITTGSSGSMTGTSLSITSAASFTLTLPSPSALSGQWIYIKQTAAFAVTSASSNVIPQSGTQTAGTAILPATAGAWAALQSNGSNWAIMMTGT